MKTSMRENNLLRADSKRPTRHITKLISLALIAPLFLCVFAFQADAQGLERIEAGADYNFVHTNAPPGACGCFSMNGGDGWAGWRFTDHISGVFQVASQHAQTSTAQPPI